MDSLTIKNSTVATTWRVSPDGDIFVVTQTIDVAGAARITTNVFSKYDGITLMEWLSEATA